MTPEIGYVSRYTHFSTVQHVLLCLSFCLSFCLSVSLSVCLSVCHSTIEGKESIEITVSKKWVRAMTLKDVQTLARMAFDDNHTSFSSFNVVPRSILITWFFPKRLTAKLQQLAMTNAFVFQQQDVRDVTVAGMVCIQATQLQ